MEFHLLHATNPTPPALFERPTGLCAAEVQRMPAGLSRAGYAAVLVAGGDGQFPFPCGSSLSVVQARGSTPSVDATSAMSTRQPPRNGVAVRVIGLAKPIVEQSFLT